MATDVAGYDVTVTLLTETKLVATVRLSSTRNAIVSLGKKVLADNGAVVSEASATCSICRKFVDTGLLCPEMVAAILSSNDMLFGDTWSIYDMQFATVERHTSRWLKQLSVDVPLFPFTAFEQSSGQDLDTTYGETPVLSWKHPPPRTGRKSKRQTDREAAEKEGKVSSARAYHCCGCGKDGHNLSTCFEIDLDCVCAEWSREAVRRRGAASTSGTASGEQDDFHGPGNSESVRTRVFMCLLYIYNILTLFSYAE